MLSCRKELILISSMHFKTFCILLQWFILLKLHSTVKLTSYVFFPLLCNMWKLRCWIIHFIFNVLIIKIQPTMHGLPYLFPFSTSQTIHLCCWVFLFVCVFVILFLFLFCISSYQPMLLDGNGFFLCVCGCVCVCVCVCFCFCFFFISSHPSNLSCCICVQLWVWFLFQS
jgi:hypothetical protein